MIEIRLSADKPLTTADLGWFVEAVNGASGHSGEDYPVTIERDALIAKVPSGDDDA